MPLGTVVALVVAALVVGLGLGTLLRRRPSASAELARLALERETAALHAALDAGGGVALWKGAGAEPELSPGLRTLLGLTDEAVGIAAVTRRLAPDAATPFAAALDGLRSRGAAFDDDFQLDDGRVTVHVAGRRCTAPGAASVDLVWFRDTTRWQQAISAAERARDRLMALLDSLPLPVWSRDADLDPVYCNAAYARAVDSSREEAVARRIEIAAGAMAEGGRALARRARELRLAQSESQHIVVGGSLRLYDFTEQPLADGAIAGHARDVTSLESTQAELARHISAHAEVLEHLGTGIVIFGPDARVKFFNSAYLRQFGLEEGFLRDEPTMGEVFEVLRERRRLPEHADFPTYKRELVRQLMGIISQHEELVHLPDGMTLRMVAAPHPFGGVLITYEDVTDTLALERSYNTLIEVQRETLDHMYEGVAVFGGDGRLKLSNPAFARLWGLDAAEFGNEPHVDRIVERIRGYFSATEDWPTQRDGIISRIADREARTGRLERADGSVLDYASVPLPDGACLISYLDVTDSIRVERALRERNAALETADRLKSEFIANVSYELRTPLNAIIGFAEILDLQYFGQLNERQIEYSRGIVEASQRLLSLINDILDIASIEAGYLRLDLGPVDVRGLLANLQGLAAERARNRELTLSVDCPADIGTLVADERRLKQAIYNLISNAINFTLEGGTITLSAQRRNGEILLSVADTGVGIAPEDEPIVFEKFARGSRQGTEGGVGLGLALVKSLIELHGGRVELESRPGEGTRVTCRMPDRPAGDAALPSA